MSKTRASFWAVVGVLLLAGCAHTPAVKVDNSEQPYRIGREDVLDVAVWRDPDLSRTLPVRPDGYISMPMTGDVLAAGKTPTELTEELKARLQPYVQEPRVTVIVREVNSSRVFVTGEVARPGRLPAARAGVARPGHCAGRRVHGLRQLGRHHRHPQRWQGRADPRALQRSDLSGRRPGRLSARRVTPSSCREAAGERA